MSNQERDSSLKRENPDQAGPSTSEPCCSKTVKVYRNRKLEAQTEDTEVPGTSQTRPYLKIVEWETLEKNWCGYSSTNATKRAPKRFPEPIRQYTSIKGKGVGKGKRNHERIPFAATSTSTSQANEPIAEDINMDTSNDEPMDLSFNDNNDPVQQYSIEVIKKPHPMVTLVNASVDFHCQFDSSEQNHFFKWIVGNEKITCSDNRFRVACKGGFSLLNIPYVEKEMAGLVICQLRILLPNGRSQIIAYSSCNITIVPNVVHVQNMPIAVGKLLPFEIMSCKYSKWSSNRLIFTSDVPLKKWFQVVPTKLKTEELLFDLEYCRLEDDYHYFLNVTNLNRDVKFIIMTVQENKCNENFLVDRQIKINWDYQDCVDADDVWYQVDYLTADGYYLLGVTSKPALIYYCPNINAPTHFRVTTTVPFVKWKSAQIAQTNRQTEARFMPLDFTPHPLHQFSRNYMTLQGVFGYGAYGTVCIANHKETGKDYAVKTINIISYEHRDACSREFHLLKSFDHPKIVKMYDAYQNLDILKLVMECLNGGNLYERFSYSTFLTEIDVVPYIRQICEGLQYLHQNNIIHLDLKPENIMCVHPNSRLVKLVDFGMSRHSNPSLIPNQHGSRDYVCPEIISYNQLTVQCDMWSLGVIAYILLSAMPPFCAMDWNDEPEGIVRAQYSYDDPILQHVSDLAKKFMDGVLVVDPNRRMTAKQALEHTWLRDTTAEQLKNLKRFNTPRSQWQMAINTVIKTQRFEKARNADNNNSYPFS